MKAAAVFCATVVFSGAAAAAGVPQVQADEPRAYGWRVGDVVERHIEVFLPEGWRLEEDSLPRPGGRGHAIEIRRVERHDESGAEGRRVHLAVEYQVLLSPASVRTLEIAPLLLKVQGAGRSDTLRVEAAPVTVGPLVPAEVSPRRGLGEMQPDRPPPLVDDSRWRWRLVAWAVLAAMVGTGLLVLHLGLPWAARRRRPFGRAWRALRGLGPEPATAEWRAACRQLHAALDQAAGEVLFEGGVARFAAAQPRYAALAGEISRFLVLSRREFFGGGAREAGDAAWLLGLARRLRDAERGGP